MAGARNARAADAGGSRGRTYEPHVRAETRHSRTAGLHRQSAEDEWRRLDVLQGAAAERTAQLRRLDSPRETAGDARAPDSRIDRAPGGRKETWLEVGACV